MSGWSKQLLTLIAAGTLAASALRADDAPRAPEPAMLGTAGVKATGVALPPPLQTPPRPVRRSAAPVPTSSQPAVAPTTAAPGSHASPSSILKVGSNGNGDWNSGVYSYDGAGNIYKIGTNYYDYDGASRLVNGTPAYESSVSSTHHQTFSYDVYGNMISRRTDDDPGTDEALAVLSSNRLQGVTYSASGNVEVLAGNYYTWDALDVMTAKSLAATGTPLEQYLYDADDERIATITPTVTTYTLRGPDQKVLRELTDTPSGGAHHWTWKRDYVYRDDLLLAQVLPKPDGPGELTRHFHLDHLGSTRVVTNDSGTRTATLVYWPFGEEAPLTDLGDGRDPLRYTGHEYDTGGAGVFDLNYMHARYQLPRKGRFLSVDPTWESADLGKPQTWNRYSYVLNNPVRHTDPDGRVCADMVSCGAEIGFTVGNVPGMVIGIVGGAAIGYGITHPEVVAALGNGMGGGDSPALERHVRNVSNHLSEKLNASQGNSRSSASNGNSSASPQDPKNDKSREKSIKSLEQRIDEHKQKLEAYKANPDAFDNKGILKNAPNAEVRQGIIDGRIKHLEHEIQTFQNQVDALRNQ